MPLLARAGVFGSNTWAMQTLRGAAVTLKKPEIPPNLFVKQNVVQHPVAGVTLKRPERPPTLYIMGRHVVDAEEEREADARRFGNLIKGLLLVLAGTMLLVFMLCCFLKS